jgi:AcrR family transcriptional regulator
LTKSRNNKSKAESLLHRKNDPGQFDKPRRRRRKPAAAETEILDAAEAFLKQLPFSEMTVDEVMSRTGLSRPSFYEYFRDRNHLLMKLIERLGDWTYACGDDWMAPGGGTVEQLRISMQRLSELYSDRGHLLRALADAAASNREVGVMYRRFLSRFVDGTAARIRQGINDGKFLPCNPEEVSTALVLLNERYMIESAERSPQPQVRQIAETLFTIWKRVLYPS